MREWRIAAIVFALAALLFTAKGFLPGRVFLPLDLVLDYGAWKHDPNVRVKVSNSLLSDSILEFRPWDHEVRRLVASGQFPWKNVWAGDGQHLFANPEASLLFPLTWLRVAMGDHGWALNAFFKLFLAALGMWWLARVATKCDWRSALVAGFVYMTCGYMTVWLLSPHTNVYAMLPWLAASALTKRHAATFAFAALATAGGHPETLFYGVVAIAIYLWSARWLVPAFLGFALCAVQLVPFAIAASHSDLLAQRLQTAAHTRWFAMPATLIPGYLGSPLKNEIDLSALGGENFNERAGGYAGLCALIVVLAAWRRVPRRALVIALAALVLSWHLPLLRIVAKLPGATERLGLVFSFFVCLCLPAALESFTPKRIWIVLGVALAAAGIFLALPIAKPLLTDIAQKGIAMLQHRGYLHRPPQVYEARLAGYLAGFATVALRRIAVPGLCLVLLGCSKRFAIAAIAIEMIAFAYGYNPAMCDVPQPRLPRDARYFLTADFEVFPPNLATLQQVRDFREYDVLKSGTPNAKPRWLVTDNGVKELPGATPHPMPQNAPPPGVGIGLAITLVALAIESFLHDRQALG
ncbi:MAG TPA: hypothetical protein VJZ76_07910 [Thermoanaerobaculia bacterium]|nr:hypothetical protein [Thermoanaerobaculia bacterium]